MKLTPEEKRIKIAEECGWKKHPQFNDLGIDPNGNSNVWLDYLNDLNAMHEAEKIMTYDQHCAYADLLDLVVGGPAYRPGCRATATQRAEAFGLTLNLWSEEQ